MSLGKKDICKNISAKTHITHFKSKNIFESFINIILRNVDNRSLKIPNFGVFSNKITKERIGRNPKTKKEYIIKQRNKLSFSPSNTIKTKFN